MKKLLTGVATGILTIGLLSACGGSNSNNDVSVEAEEKTTVSFISDVEKALDKRWSENDKWLEKVKDKSYEEIMKISDGELAEHYEKLVSYEAKLYPYLEKDFGDEKLQRLVEQYLGGVKSQEEAIQYISSNEDKYDKLWSKGYDERSSALLTLVEEYGLEVDEDQFKELKTNGKIQEMVNNINFEKVDSEYGWETYQAVVENVSGTDLAYFDIDINLIDEDGVVIDTAYAYHSNTWKDTQKVRFEFETSTTDFDHMEWEVSYDYAE